MNKNVLVSGQSIAITRAIRRRLAKDYNQCFAEYPWCEIFTSGEAAKWLRTMINYPDNISLGWRTSLGRIVGAAFTFPVSFESDVASFLPKDIAVDKVIYVADVFVRKSCRNQGIANRLIDECLDIAKQKDFSFVISRTNLESKMCPIFRDKGYELIGMQQVISKKLVDGKAISAPDERGIFFRIL